MPRLLVLAITAACRPASAPDPTEAPGSPGDPTPSTGVVEPPPPPEGADCHPTANPLRFACAASLPEPAAVELVLTPEGKDEPVRRFTSGEVSAVHEVLAWGLLPDTAYRWELAGRSGTLTTGSLPPELASAEVSVTGQPFGFDGVLHPLLCDDTGYFTILDPSGRIIWFEPNDVWFTHVMNGYEWSQEARTVLSAGPQRVLEQHVSGRVELDLRRGTDFGHIPHHDLERWGPYRYVLFERLVDSRFVDGIHVFDGRELVDTWYMEDDFDVSGPGRGDWGHANGLEITDDGELVLSVLNFSSVMALDGDPSSETFLELRWHASGDPDGPSLPGADYVALDGAGEGFERQHNVTRVGDELWVFDNVSQPTSRAIRLLMDHSAGTLALLEAWSLDATCRNQGGALPIAPDPEAPVDSNAARGGVLATCANLGRVWQFAHGAEDPSWTLEATCGGRSRVLRLTRAIPVRVE